MTEDSVLEQPQTQATKVEPVHAVVAEFDNPQHLVAAARALRESGYTRLDAYTPFPVHGLEEALGLHHSRLGWLVLGGGLVGAAVALLLQWWTSAVDYPLTIGGKPPFAFQFSIPITFEITVLFAAFAAVLGMLVANGLPRFYHPIFKHGRFDRAMDDRFLLAIEGDIDPDGAAEVLREAGGRHVEVVAA